MSISVINELVGGAGVAGVWLVCILLGLMVPKQQVDDLKASLRERDTIIATERQRADNERQRADSAIEAAHTSNILLAGLRKATDEAQA